MPIVFMIGIPCKARTCSWSKVGACSSRFDAASTEVAMIIVLGRALCVFGRHRRSRGKAHVTETGMISTCRFCERPMMRLGHDRWTVSA
jgi:hypothetical protein